MTDRARTAARRATALLAAGLLGLAGLGAAGTPAAAQTTCAAAGQNLSPSPWAQQLVSAQRVWPFTEGAGQTVAVLDSGVDANVAQLHGRVSTGYDAVAGAGGANTDCSGAGTEIAGVIAAAGTTSGGIYGVAPAVNLLPVRVIDPNATSGTPPVTATGLARGIDWAVGHGADVLDISASLTVDDPRVRAAVAAALAANVTVVAAVGDQGAPDDGNPTPYPAAYPGVIGVGAIDQIGQRWASSQHGPYVSLVAPGVEVPALQRGHGLANANGTAIAAGFVSGTAALARARWPRLNGPALTARLLGTATPAAGAVHGPDFGYGVVNPYAAVTDEMPGGSPVALPAFAPSQPDRAQLARAAAWSHSRSLAVLLAVVGLLVMLVLAAIAMAVPRARRGVWRPTLAAPLRQRPEPEEPAPPAQLFEDITR
jgi:type VII secretion-associated serine protease mycosin